MKYLRLVGVVIVLLMISTAVAGAVQATPTLVGPCQPGADYEPGCDVNHDSSIDLVDIMLTAAKWNQTGRFTSDNDHEHLNQTWSNSRVPLKIQGNFDGTAGSLPAALVLVNTRASGPGNGLWIDSVTGNGVHVKSASMDGVYVCTTGSATGCTLSTENNGVEVGNAEDNGIFVKSAGNDGVVVSSAADDGIFVNTSNDDGLHVGLAGNDGLQVDNAPNGRGVNVYSAGGEGFYVDSAGGDGIRICRTGTATTCTASTDNNGVEIGAAQHDGVVVTSAGDDGLVINSANDDGIYVNSAGGVGVYVCTTGNASFCSPSTYHNGLEVGNAQDDGLHVAAAGKYGLYVNSAGYDAIHVAGTNGDGVDVSADDYGLIVSSAGTDGLKVLSAGNDGLDVTGGSLAGYFNGHIQVTGGCTGCTLATFALNTGDTELAFGDIVSLAGLRESGVDSVPMLMEVEAASDSDIVVGVVSGWAELVTEEKPRPSEIGKRLVPRDGAAEPGQYVTVVYSGLAQVRASAAGGAITQGSKLAAGEAGTARALRTVDVQDVKLAENASTIGIALESLDAGDEVPERSGVEGLIWVLVNPQ